MKTIRTLLFAALMTPVVAAAAENVKLDRAPIDGNDLVSLQRGAHTFVNCRISGSTISRSATI
jgi:ubiquinol-cytochrome c reductase cytochrome c1 subunit